MKNPYTKYSIFALSMQLIMWIVFTLYDYAFDEHHLISDDSNLDVFMGYIAMGVIFLMPFTVYLYMKNKHFSTEYKFVDCFVHTFVWAVIGFIISSPLWSLVNSHKWIVLQEYSHGGFIDMNGIEYLAIPLIQILLCIAIFVSTLISAISQKRK